MMQQEKHQFFMHETLICIIHPHQTSGIISKELAHISSIPSKTLFRYFYFRLLIDGESCYWNCAYSHNQLWTRDTGCCIFCVWKGKMVRLQIAYSTLSSHKAFYDFFHAVNKTHTQTTSSPLPKETKTKNPQKSPPQTTQEQIVHFRLFTTHCLRTKQLEC